MKASLLYRIAAVLLLLFAIGHTLGFRQSDPHWGADAMLASMRAIRFDMMGFDRSYWELFEATGFCVGLFYLFSAMLAWQLGGLPVETRAQLRGTTWAFALCYAGIFIISWMLLFLVPVVFSALITLCLTAAAWRSAKEASAATAR